MSSLNFEARQAKNRLDEIKHLLKCGELSPTDAAEEAKLPLKQLNEGMRAVSQSYGFKHRNVTFAQYMR